MKIFIPTIIFVAAFSSLRTSAQVVYIPELDPVAMHLRQQLYQTMAFGEMNIRAAGGKTARGAQPTKSPNAPAPTPQSATSFRLTNGGRILPERLSSASGKDAAAVRNARQIFDMFLDNYEKTARTDGFPSNDLAYGLTFFVVNNYIVYRDLQEKSPADKALMKQSGDPLLALQHSYSKKAGAVTPTAERAVYQQVFNLMSANPGIADLTDRQKQEFTEMLALVTVMTYYAYDTAGKNENAKAFAEAQSSAKQALESMLGAPADQVKITAQGLEF